MDPGFVTPSSTIKILKKFNIRLTKRLGQNFLVDKNILKKIITAASLTPHDNVLEVGPGIGTLTYTLAQEVNKVIAVELDKRLVNILKETLRQFDNIIVIEKDALKLNLRSLPQDFPQPNKMVSNLPFNIATPLLAQIIQDYPQIELLVVTVQKEVAERIVAKAGSKDYGYFSLKVQYHTQPEIVARVPKTVFIPPPKVDSAIVKIIRTGKPKVQTSDEPFLFKVIEASFAQRRKTIKNCLTSRLGLDEGTINQALEVANIDSKRRGETLTLDQFANLSDALTKYIS